MNSVLDRIADTAGPMAHDADLRLGGVHFLAGPAVGLEEWCARNGAGEERLALFRQMGLAAVAQEPLDRRQALVDCMHGAIGRAGLRAADIAAVCFAPPSFAWSREAERELLEALAGTQLGRLPLIGVGLQGCSALGAMVETGAAWAGRRQGPVLLVFSALPPGGACFDPAAERLFGCGVACCVLAQGQGEYRIRAAATFSDSALALATLRGDGSATFRQSWQLLQDVVGDALGATGASPQDIAFLCGSTISEQALLTASLAAAIPRERLWKGGLRDVGHLYSADALVSLARLEESGLLRPGALILLTGWSQWTASGVVVESV